MEFDLDPLVTIYGLDGGYMVQTDNYNPEEKEFMRTWHVCASIDEVLRHATRAIKDGDKHTAETYDNIEKELGKKRK